MLKRILNNECIYGKHVLFLGNSCWVISAKFDLIAGYYYSLLFHVVKPLKMTQFCELRIKWKDSEIARMIYFILFWEKLSNPLCKNEVNSKYLGKPSLKNRNLKYCNGRRLDGAVQSVCATSSERVTFALGFYPGHLVWSSSSWAVIIRSN